MARGKHSPALFEVVHGKKHLDSSAAAILRTPNWWFKGRHRGPAASGVDVAAEPPSFSDEVDPTQPALPPPEREPKREIEPPTVEYKRSLDDPTDPTSFAAPQPRRKGSPFQFVVDRDRQELFLRVRYTTAIVAGFALFVVIGLAYVTGRHFGRGPSTVLAIQSSEEVAAGPIERGVLDVGRGSSGGFSSTSSGGIGLGAGGVSAQPAAARLTEASVGPPTTTTPAASPKDRQPSPSEPAKSADYQNGRRIVGKQYVVIQAYAGDQKKLAEEARDFLIKNGVSCTVEKGVAGWPSTWHSVVSTQGFDRASGPQFDGYRQNVIKLGNEFAGKSAWKRFEPTAVRWKEN